MQRLLPFLVREQRLEDRQALAARQYRRTFQKPLTSDFRRERVDEEVNDPRQLEAAA
jgi:hypothetical protein